MSGTAHFRRVDELFRGACRLAPAERAGFLDKACAGDPSLRDEVIALLGEDAGAEGFLESPALGDRVSPGEFARDGAGTPRIPERIGQYRILRVLGEGGMGVVYEAEQPSTRRSVALKVIRPDLTSRAVLRRFELEAQVLARLTHPGIAQVYEAGAEEDAGRPRLYFAMELVRGLPLIEYAEAKGLGLRERLALFARVCDAVHHAHQNGIIHRDLKPGNILVEESGQPKVLDFGVARALDPDRRATLHTDPGQIVGTVPYMSPEQASGDAAAADTRSDVYSLGVVLFELLTGRLPYEIGDRPFFEVVRVIREHEPVRPSTIDRRLRGDAETIVCKALEKEKERRYQSGADLAVDIRRFLENLPILARPATAAYQFRKFARRHTGLVAALAAVLLVLVGGIAGIGVALRRAVAAQERAEMQASIAQAVNDFVNKDLLAAADPSIGSKDLTVRAALDRASSHVAGRFEGSPLVEAAVRGTIGRTYCNLGDHTPAEEHLVRALSLREEHAGPDASETLESVADLALLRQLQSRLEESGVLFERLHSARALGADHAATLDSAVSLASLEVDRGGYQRAEALLTGVLESGRDVLGPDHATTLAAKEMLAGLYEKTRKNGFVDAEPLLRQVYEANRRLLGERHRDTLSAQAALALVIQRQRRFDEAEPLSRSAVEGYRAVLGGTHQDTLTAVNNLALLLVDQGRHAEADSLMLEVLEIRRRTLGEDNVDTLVSMLMLAKLYRNQARYAEAEALALPACGKILGILGPTHGYSKVAVSILAQTYEAWGKPEQAAEWRGKVAPAVPSASDAPAGQK